MSKEIELKLLINKADIGKLSAHPVIQTYSRKHVNKFIKNTYFDTPDLQLSHHHAALRVREIDHNFYQTFKGANQSHDGLHEREEFEIEIKTSQIEFEKFPETIRDFLAPFAKSLTPVFTTNFHREIWNLILNGGTILELALDQGIITANNKTSPILEIEIELKQGNTDQIWVITNQLKQSIHLIPENKSKAERGYQLLHQESS